MADRTSVSAPDVCAQGLLLPDGSAEYRGLRYATADRFAPPVDADPISEPVSADSWGPLSPQNPGFLELMAGYDASAADENCLVLNVFTPPGANDTSNLPVMFWIHGGAYLTGGGSLAWYHGANLARRGAVVVTINYRLGVLGYLGRTNLGTLDQISALRWVSRNIRAFGGNPDNVTVFGESAGGSAIVALMAAPSAAGLFHRAWAMSPSIGQLRDSDRADEAQRELLEIAGATSPEELAALSVDALLAAQATLVTRPSRGYDHFSPTSGGAGLPDEILGAAAKCPVPLVIGTTRDENKLFTAFDEAARAATETDRDRVLHETFGDCAHRARETYGARRGGEPWEMISAVATDVAFRQPAIRLASARSSAGTPTWMYWFTHASTAFGGRFGSCHALDLPFAFSTLDADGAGAFTGESVDHPAVAERFGHELLSLATHGHPSWAQYDLDKRHTLEIAAEPTLLSDPESDIRVLFH